MADREVTRLVYTLQEEIGDLRKQIKTLQSAPALRNASIEDTSIPVVDRDGNITSVIGRQSDGSSGVSVRRSPFQPMPTAPALDAGEQAGTCKVGWDGNTHFPGDPVPIIFGKIEIWAYLLGDGEEPTTAPNPGAVRVGTIRDRDGGEVLVALPKVGTWAVWLRMVGADGQTTGLWSPAATVEISGKVDEEAIWQRIGEEADRITEADERLTSGQFQLEGNLGDLDDRKAERQELTDGLAGANAHAESVADDARVMAVSEAAADAQVEYDRLQAAADRALGAQPNFFRDGGFDDPTMAHWNFHIASYRQSTGGRTSAPSYLVPADLSSNHFPQTAYFPCEPGQTFYIEGYVKREAAETSSRQLSLFVRTLNDSGARSSFSPVRRQGQTMPESQWVKLSVVFEVPDGQKQIRFSFHTEALLTAAYRWDDLRAVDISEFAPTIKEAELARLRAEEAHLAAGEAHDLAASAYASASTKNTIHWDLSAPSGTGSNGDVWWQYEVRNAKRVVIGSWHWDSGVWEPDELAEEYLPLVNIGTGTYGDLSGQRLIADTVTSNVVDTDEFFAAQAVIEKVWADIVRTRLIASEGIITEDMIATGAITTPKLTVTEEMVAQIASFIRVEAGSLASNDIEAMRIVSSLIEATTYLIHDANGDVSVRLDGMDNYLAGRLQAGMAGGSSISLDYGEKVRFSGLNEEGEPDPQRVISTPYLNFHTPNIQYQANQEPSIHLDQDDPNGRDGMMIINPGYPIDASGFRAKLNVVGDMQANRLEARDRISTPIGIRVGPTSNQPGGVFADGLRTRHQGRMPADQGPHDTIIYGSSTTRQMEPDSAVRGQLTFDSPTPTGVRRCTVSAHVANTTWGYDNNRGATASSAAASASSMRYTLQPARNNTGTVEAWCYYAAYWV